MGWGIVSAVIALFVVALAGCTEDSTQPAKSDKAASSVTTAVLPSECKASKPKHGALPETFEDSLDSSANWIGDNTAVAVLFYAPANDVTIGTRGTMGPGKNSKILWLVAGHPKGPLTLKATNLTTGTRVRQAFTGSGDFPSIPVLPDPGCWQINAVLGSKTVMQIVLLAEDETDSASARPRPLRRSGCIKTKGVENVTSGAIHAGPFNVNRSHWSQPGGTKFWVASQKPRGRTGATIHATLTDDTNKQVVIRRGPKDRATPLGGSNPPAEFYPGRIRLPAPGTWRLTITIGHASDCFLVTVPKR